MQKRTVQGGSARRLHKATTPDSAKKMPPPNHHQQQLGRTGNLAWRMDPTRPTTGPINGDPSDTLSRGQAKFLIAPIDILSTPHPHDVARSILEPYIPGPSYHPYDFDDLSYRVKTSVAAAVVATTLVRGLISTRILPRRSRSGRNIG